MTTHAGYSGSRPGLRNMPSRLDDTTAGARGISANERVYRALKQLILIGRVMPGVQLTHEGLASELGVSRTPVREALERLNQEGFVAHRRNRGYFVADLTPQEVSELFGVRAGLELYALEESWRQNQHINMQELQRINQDYRSAILVGASKKRMIVDQEFHLELAKQSGNTLLCRTLGSVFERIILKRRVQGYTVAQGLDAYEEHETLIRHLSLGHYEDARSALRDHILRGRDRLLAQLVQEADDDFGGALQPDGPAVHQA